MKPSERIKARAEDFSASITDDDALTTRRLSAFAAAVLEHLDEEWAANQNESGEVWQSRINEVDARMAAARAKQRRAHLVPEGGEEFESEGMPALRYLSSLRTTLNIRVPAKSEVDFLELDGRTWSRGKNFFAPNSNAIPWVEAVWAEMSEPVAKEVPVDSFLDELPPVETVGMLVEELEQQVADRDARIAELEAEVERLRALHSDALAKVHEAATNVALATGLLNEQRARIAELEAAQAPPVWRPMETLPQGEPRVDEEDGSPYTLLSGESASDFLLLDSEGCIYIALRADGDVPYEWHIWCGDEFVPLNLEEGRTLVGWQPTSLVEPVEPKEGT